MVALNEARAFVSMCSKGQHTNKEGTPSVDTWILMSWIKKIIQISRPSNVTSLGIGHQIYFAFIFPFIVCLGVRKECLNVSS